MTVDLLYSGTEDALRESLRALLSAICPPSRVSAAYDGDTSIGLDVWRGVSEALDLPAIGIPEALGGSGANPREIAVVMEELGRVVAPIPFLTSAVIATRTLLAAGGDDQVRSLVTGSRIAALAVPFTTIGGLGRPLPSVNAGRVRGTVRAVAGAESAGLLLVPALDGEVLTLQAVEPQSPTTRVRTRTSLDMTRPISDLTFDAALATEVARDEAAEAAIRAGLIVGSAMLASEQVGVAEACLETTVAYVKQRHQFGRPVGSFQAVKHRLARLWIEVNSARAAARNAAVLVDGRDGAALTAVAIAQAHCSDVAVLAAEEGIQLHGGIGMTWEHPTHLYLKRAMADQLALGTSAQYRARLARKHDL
jgi:alkylation response protein AidB-like acyl-CoA dehydrogenase